MLINLTLMGWGCCTMCVDIPKPNDMGFTYRQKKSYPKETSIHNRKK